MLREIFPKLQAFDQIRPADESWLRRSLRRYYDPSRLKPITDLDRCVEQADTNRHNWTFWIVCHC
jgi:hypothetical protein